MKRTILIPTDFSIDSLIPLKLAADIDNYSELEIVLMFSALSPSSITDLLFYKPSKIIDQYCNHKFKEACDVIVNRYESKIKKIRIEVFHGTTESAFDNFLAGNKIDEIIYPKNYILKQYKNSFNPIKFIKNSFLPCREVDWKANNPTQTACLSTLFLDNSVISVNHS